MKPWVVEDDLYLRVTTINNHGVAGEGFTLKACKACCMSVKYCNPACQKNHWPTHKKICKQRAAELRDVALFKDPPAKEDCPICFLPMPVCLIFCVSLPPATILSVPIYDFAMANQVLRKKAMKKKYYSCCGKSICAGCIHSLCESENIGKCPFCSSNRASKTDEDILEDIMKRVEANDPASIGLLASHYNLGKAGIQRDQTKAIELFTKSAELGCSKAHCQLGNIYDGGDMKKAKFHFEAAAMAGHEGARFNLGVFEANSGNMERAVEHWTIAASHGEFQAMHHLRELFKGGVVRRESIDSTLAAYNNSCKEMRSEARDAMIHD